jgi:hypothetical protein
MTSSTAIIYLILTFRYLPLYEGLQHCLGSQMVTDKNVVSWASDATRSSPHSKGSHTFVHLYLFYAAIENSVNHYRTYIPSVYIKIIFPQQKDNTRHRNAQSSHQPNLPCHLIPYVPITRSQSLNSIDPTHTELIQRRRACQHEDKKKKHTTGGIPRWSPTLVLVARFSAYVWQSGRFSLTYGCMYLSDLQRILSSVDPQADEPEAFRISLNRRVPTQPRTRLRTTFRPVYFRTRVMGYDGWALGAAL